METLADRRFRTDAERNGGFQAFSRSLQRAGMTPDSYKDTIRQQLYRFAWQGAVTGRQAGTTGRMEIDRYVRPGEIRKTYRNFKNSRVPAEREIVGFTEQTFKVREIGMSFELRGGREVAVDRANALRKEFVEGRMSMEDMVRRWAEENPRAEEDSLRTWTLSEATNISQRTFGSDRFLKFLQTAEPGQISDPLESSDAVHLFQFLESTPASEAREFENWQVQEDLREHLLNRRDSKRLGRAFGQLLAENPLNDRSLTQFMLDPAWLERDRANR